MHEMANTIVIAEDDQVWGVREINKTNLNIVYDTAMAIEEDNPDKARFINIAERWRDIG
jgi:hypothetical protein